VATAASIQELGLLFEQSRGSGNVLETCNHLHGNVEVLQFDCAVLQTIQVQFRSGTASHRELPLALWLQIGGHNMISLSVDCHT
jgi:hypothetical protein